MFRVRIYDQIDQSNLNHLNQSNYIVGSGITYPDAILCRSQNLHTIQIPSSVKVIGRAGIGTDNIPIDLMTQRGIPVLNTPGANANAVKELTITGMLLACRHIPACLNYTRTLHSNSSPLSQAEKNKHRLAGFELAGKKLGVIGLGNIGIQVANAGCDLDMDVIAFGPTISNRNTSDLNPCIKKINNIDEIFQQSDFISIHVPLTSKTKNIINNHALQLIQPHVILLNFSRHGIVDNDAILSALNHQKLAYYVCDFPDSSLLTHPKVICLPHIGGSTREAEKNCTQMATQQLKNFLETGEIRHAVNFPTTHLIRRGDTYRIGIIGANTPNIVANISENISNKKLNIVDMISQSKKNITYTLLDMDSEPDDSIIESLKRISGVIKILRF